MLGLRPEMRTPDQVEDRGPGGEGNKEIIDGRKRERFGVQVESSYFCGDDRRRKHRPDPGEREDINEDVRRLAPGRGDALPRLERAHEHVQGEGRPEQRAQHGAGDQDRRGKCAKPAEGGNEAEGLARVDDRGLQPAFLPAHALTEPVAELVRGFLRCIRAQAAYSAAEARQPDAEIGVLGDVPCVPAANPRQAREAEMIGAAAERDRQAERAEPRIDQIEQDGVLRGEQLRQRNYVADATALMQPFPFQPSRRDRTCV
jgi:hypothetical protein